MKTIENKKWKERIVRLVEGKQVEEEQEASLVVALNSIMSMAGQDDVPKGFDKFRSYGRIAKAFDKAEEEDTLELEDADYALLKKLVDKNIPATWGVKQEALDAIEAFMDAE